MPEKGFKSITVPVETREYIEEIFKKYEKEFKRRGIRSVPQLVHHALISYIEEFEEEMK